LVDEEGLGGSTPGAVDGGRISAPRLTLAVLVAVTASLGACALIALAATTQWPRLAGYSHFGFGDYAPLSAAGVVAAGLAWPVVVRISARPSRLYLSLAAAVSLAALLPDVGLLVEGESAKAVGALVAMHVAVAVVTCCLILLVASPRRAQADGATLHGPRRRSLLSVPSARTGWLSLAALVGVVGILGVAALVVVPMGRSTVLVPMTGRVVYLLHALSGGVLAVGAAIALILAWDGGDRLARRSSVAGLLGTALGAGGGLLTVLPAQRVLGIVLMLAGVFVAGVAYLTPTMVDAPLAGAGSPLPGPSGGEDKVLVCERCGQRAAEEQSRRDPALSVGDWGTELLASGACYLCPDTGLAKTGDVTSCPCCRSVFRQPAGGDGRTWIVTPGPGTLEIVPAPGTWSSSPA
jgi:hypothetical protein